MAHETRFRILRVLLLFSSFAWAVSVFGVFLSWDSAVNLLQGLGSRPVEYDRMLDYWLRMASGAFTLVGLMYLALALNPQRYAVALPLFGWLMVVEGVVLLVHGLRLHLPPFPFVADTTACFLGGIGILSFQAAAISPGEASTDAPLIR